MALPATLVFDYPTPAALAQFIRTELLGEAAVTANDPDAPIREHAGVDPDQSSAQAGLLDLVLQLAQDSGENNSALMLCLQPRRNRSTTWTAKPSCVWRSVTP